MFSFWSRSGCVALTIAALAGCAASGASFFPTRVTSVSGQTGRSLQTPRTQAYSVLYSFGNVSGEGNTPNGPLIADEKGNLYGTTTGGGSSNNGTVFELQLTHQGALERTLYSFKGNADGGSPRAGLLAGPNGVFFGTTMWGGLRTRSCGGKHKGCGVVFELMPIGRNYKETVLYSFSGADGMQPYSTLVSDTSGALYGTASGGAHRYGVVFKLTPNGQQFAESIAYAFQGFSDGAEPTSSLTLDGQGSIYGATASGGYLFGCDLGREGGCGVIYKLVPSGSVYNESVLFAFAHLPDGYIPSGSLLVDDLGDVFGTTTIGGVRECYNGNGCGTAFELVPSASGYGLVSLRAFQSYGDANYPIGGLILAGNSDLYGTGEVGGANGYGAIFELLPTASGYSERLLHSFGGGKDGSFPASTLLSVRRRLYGTTPQGGNAACSGYGCGTVFEVKL